MTEYNLEKTKNLHILTVPHQGSKAITVMMLFGSGSRHEDKNFAGIAHFTEHMVLTGTKKRPTQTQLGGVIDKVGARYNAFTGKEFTGFYGQVMAEKFEAVLDFISDGIQNSLLKQSVIENERTIILQELNMFLDTPTRYIHDIYEDIVWPNHQLGAHIAGTKESVKKIDQNAIRNQIKNYTAPESALILVGNPKTISRAAKIAKKYFKLPENKKRKDTTLNIQQTEPNILNYYKKTDQAHLLIGFRTCGINNNKDAQSLSILKNILAGYLSARLYTILREKHGLTYDCRAFSDHYSDSGSFEIKAGVANNKAQKTVDLVLKEIEKLKKGPIPQSEFKKAQDNLIGNIIIDFEDQQDLALFYGNQKLYGKKILTSAQILNITKSLTPADIQKTAREYFTSNRLNIALIGQNKVKL